MADGHQHAADDERPVPAELVCDHAAEDRCQVYERGVGAEDRRREGLPFEAGVEVLLHPFEADHLLHLARHEQVIDHVEHEQRLHRVIGEALAGLGEAEIAEALRMADESPIQWVDMLQVRLCVGHRHLRSPKQCLSRAKR